jgi:hypothetical protein
LSGLSAGSSEAWIWNDRVFSGDTSIEWRMQFTKTPSDDVGKHGGIMSFSTTKTQRYSSSGYTIDWIDRTSWPYDHGFRVYRWDNGASGNPFLLGVMGSSFNLVEDQWYDWKVVMVNGDITLYVDGVLIGTVHDSGVHGAPYTSGYVGFWLWYNGEAQFDDLCVESISSPLSNWEMRLYDSSGNIYASTPTNVNGYYEFTVMHPGIYSIAEVLKAGWTAVCPVYESGTPEVIGYSGIGVKSGVNVCGRDFWNFEWAHVKVMKVDTDGKALPGWEITLDGVTQTTGDDGSTTFTVKTPGEYTVSEVLKGGWTAISPTSYPVTVKTGGSYSFTFTNFEWATITVTKLEYGTGDPLAGWHIDLAGPDPQDGATGSNGKVTFTVKKPGLYTATEVLQPGWTLTSAGSFSTTVYSGGSYDLGPFENFQNVAVRGLKFNDYNGNGAQDASEPGISAWTIVLTRPDGSLVGTRLTRSDGSYEFLNIGPGAYTVSETQQGGWIQTSPGGTGAYTVATVSGQDANGKNFGNFQQVTITADKWNDLDGDGQKDGGEPEISDWELTLKYPDGTTSTKKSPTTWIVNTGGLYTLSEVGRDGWVRTTLDVNLDISSGANIPVIWFGNFKKVTITADKWDDLDGDGVQDGGEPAIVGWELTLHYPDGSTSTMDSPASWVVTKGGNYYVTEADVAGWTHTTVTSVPLNGVKSGDTPAKIWFGNFKWITVSGVKYFDADGDGARDAGEPGLANWVISIKKGGTQYLPDVKTGPDGSYSFLVKDPGMYVVSETLLNSWWKQTAPADNTYTVDARSGEGVPNLDFGNWLGSSVIVTDSSLCMFDIDNNAANGRQFKLIFTPDVPDNPQFYRLTASNPGQFYVNVFFVGDISAGETIVVTLPYPFVTQGANPVHAYSSLSIGPYGCFVPVNDISSKFTVSPTVVILDGSYDALGETKTITLTANEDYTGFVYVTVHLDYGLKKNVGKLSPDASKNAVIAGTLPSIVVIPENGPYAFTASGPDGPIGSDTVRNTNVFKRDPGFGGLVLDMEGYPVKGVKVQVYLGTTTTCIGTVYTDEDGWYMLNYKHTGKATTFTVKMGVTIGETTYTKWESVTVKANGFAVVNWIVPTLLKTSTVALSSSEGGSMLAELVGIAVLVMSLIAAAGLCRAPVEESTRRQKRTRTLRLPCTFALIE